ncbi:hypothetical protein GCM10022280_24300 [Sphingomonas swuensis]|uniref:Cell wall hydrolase SleB domain-containing protein n=1 Tax=Sphingomonas swuensis TaxID=977800 RepID=A0ABP7T8X1_9SPHN
MTKRFALGRAPAIAAFCLTLAGVASPASAQLATISAIPVSTIAPAATAGKVLAPVRPAATVLVPAPATATIATAASITPSPIGRAAVLSTTPRPTTAGINPPAGVAEVRPAVTHAGLWPMVWAKQTGAALTEQEECVAIAVYHEARGEPLDGQLAVAEVIMNRAASGRYPASWCEVVKQPWQFSFVNPRSGHMPAVKRESAAWAYAQAITRIAAGHFADALPSDVLWYHADYVAPSWGRRLAKVEKIGAHIFYRAA